MCLSLVALHLSSGALAGTVSLDPVRWAELLPAPPDPAEAPSAVVLSRDVVLEPEALGFHVRAQWFLRGEEGQRIAGLLCDGEVEVRSVRWEGEPLELRGDEQGRWFVVEGVGDGRLELDAWVAAPEGTGAIRLLDAPRGGITAPADLDLAATEGVLLPAAEGSWIGGAPVFSFRPRELAPEPGPWLQGSAVLGVEVQDGLVHTVTTLEVSALRGSFRSLSLRLPGDHRLDLPPGALLDGEGEERTLRLPGPRTTLRLRVERSFPLAEGEERTLRVELPQVPGVQRLDRFAVVGSADGVDLAVRDPGWRPVRPRELPESRNTVVSQRPVAWLRADGERDAIELVAFSFRPAERPPAVVQDSEWEAAIVDEGRALVRARWELQNEELPYLEMRLPKDARVVAVRVEDRAVEAIQDGATLRVPVPRSVETLSGPLALPVELTYLVEAPAPRPGRPWLLPAVALSVPIARLAATIHLPPGSRLPRASKRGPAPPEPAAPPGKPKAAATRAFRAAVDAWRDNDLRRARSLVDEARRGGAQGKDVQALSENLEALGLGGEVRDDAATRNLKKGAESRANEQVEAARRLEAKADALARTGQWKEAEEGYAEAAELQANAAAVAQVEDRSLEDGRTSLAEKAARARQQGARPGPARPWGDAALVGSATPEGASFGYGGLGLSGSGSGGGGMAFRHGVVVVTATTPMVPIPRLGAAQHVVLSVLPAGLPPDLLVTIRRPPFLRGA